MDKREIIIRVVECNTGLIQNETRKAVHFNFRYQRDRNEIHAYVDEFLRVLRAAPHDAALCLDIMADVPVVEARLPFIF